MILHSAILQVLVLICWIQVLVLICWILLDDPLRHVPTWELHLCVIFAQNMLLYCSAIWLLHDPTGAKFSPWWGHHEDIMKPSNVLGPPPDVRRFPKSEMVVLGRGAYGPQKYTDFFAALYVRYGPPDVSIKHPWGTLKKANIGSGVFFYLM